MKVLKYFTFLCVDVWETQRATRTLQMYVHPFRQNSRADVWSIWTWDRQRQKVNTPCVQRVLPVPPLSAFCYMVRKQKEMEESCWTVHWPVSADRSKVALEGNNGERSAFKMIFYQPHRLIYCPFWDYQHWWSCLAGIRDSFLCQIQSLPRALSVDNPHFAWIK